MEQKYFCANCGRFTYGLKKLRSTREFGGMELYFCNYGHKDNDNTDCYESYLKKHKADSVIDYGEEGSTGAFIKQWSGLNNVEKELAQTAIGSTALGLAKALKKSPQQKAKEEAERRKRQYEEHLKFVQREIERRTDIVTNYNPVAHINEKKGLFQKAAVLTEVKNSKELFLWHEYLMQKTYQLSEKSITEILSAGFRRLFNIKCTMFEHRVMGDFKITEISPFIYGYSEEINSKVPEILSFLKQYKPKLGKKLERKENILKCLQNLIDEPNKIGEKYIKNLDENEIKQKKLIEKEKSLFLELYSPLKKFNRFLEVFQVKINSLIPYTGVTKEDVQKTKEVHKNQYEKLKENLTLAKKDKVENLPKLKQEHVQIKKEYDSVLSELNKKIRRFKKYKPTAEEFESELKKISE